MRGLPLLFIIFFLLVLGAPLAADASVTATPAPLSPSPTLTVTPSPSSTLTATQPFTPTATASSTVVPSVAPTVTSLPTLTATLSSTPTVSPTLALTLSSTPTSSPTATARIETVVVTLPPAIITAPPQVLVITAPPPPAAPPAPPPSNPPAAPARQSAPAPTQQTPFYGWTRYQSVHLIPVLGAWGLYPDRSASAGQHRRSTSAGALARYPFTGEGVRVAYLRQPDGCAFDLLLDQQVLGTFTSNHPETQWMLAGPFFVDSDYHVLDLQSHNTVSGGCTLTFDYLEVFTGPPLPAGEESTFSNAPAASPQAVSRVTLLSAPPTLAPTATPVPASVVLLRVQIDYDRNANRSADLNEGVAGISVRVVDATHGTLLSSGVTDARGALRLQVVTYSPVTAHIPLLGRTLTIRPAQGQTLAQPWALLLAAANQPGVIP